MISRLAYQELGAVLAQELFRKTVTVGQAQPEYKPITIEALQLYRLGFNITPIQPRQKKPFKGWKMQHFTRLSEENLCSLFESIPDRPNIAVILGRSSGNLIVIDCETSERFMDVANLLSDKKIPLYAARSGGIKEGGHFYLRCDQELANVRLGVISDDLEIRGCRCYVLLPPSIHPITGILYQWWEGNNSDTVPYVDLETLQTMFPDVKPSTSQYSQQEYDCFPSYSKTTQDYLKHGQHIQVGQRNDALFSAACDLNGCGTSYSDASIVLVPIAEESGLDRYEIVATIKSAYSKPRNPSNPRQDQGKQLPQWLEATHWILEKSWIGQSGATDREVMLALATRSRFAEQRGAYFRASVREIAEMARVSKNTACRSLHRLQDQNYIQKSPHQDKLSGASLYRFTPEFGRSISGQSMIGTLTPTGKEYSVPISDCDLHERNGLGKITYRVWKVLLKQPNPISRSRLAKLCNISLSATSYHLKKLQDIELAVNTDHKWVGVDKDETRLAIELGVMGKSEARRNLHQSERENRAFLALRRSIHSFYARDNAK